MGLLSHRGFLLKNNAVALPLPSGPSILSDDPHYDKVTLLVNGEGPNLGTTLRDSVGNVWVSTGDIKYSTTSPMDGTSQIVLDGSGDWAESAMQRALIGTGDFTAEVDVVMNAGFGTGELICCSAASRSVSAFDLVWEINSAGAVRFSIQNGSGTALIDITSASGVVVAGVKTHIAVMAEGSTGRIKVNGTEVQSGAISGGRINANRYVRIGMLTGDLGGAVYRYLNGQIKRARVTLGVARYPGAGSYTVPSVVKYPALPWQSYDSALAMVTSNDAQGITSDGTNLYYSSSNTLYKYSKAGVLALSRSIAADAPSTKDQCNGVYYKSGILYVSCAKYAAGVGTCWIAEYDPATLLPTGVVHTLSTGLYPEAFCEGLSFYQGFWWVVFHATKIVAVYDTSFALMGTFDLTWPITGSSGGYGSGQGYEGGFWDGDYFYANIHEIYNEKYMDVYYWNGTGMTPIARIDRQIAKESQGISRDPTESDVIWISSRALGADAITRRKLIAA